MIHRITAAVLCCLLLSHWGRMASAERPHVLSIAVDVMRCDLACYGHPEVVPPHLDRLAASAARFTRAYCPPAL